MAPKIERIAEIPQLVLGEGPHWDPESQSLLFVDILEKTAYKFIPSTGYLSKVVFDKPISVIIPVRGKKDQYLVTLQRDIAIINWDGKSEKPSKIEVLAEVDVGTENRINDGKCDPRGRFFGGSMGPEPEVGHFTLEAGSFYSYAKGKLEKHAEKIGISNGLTWNPALKKMYYIDSLAYTIDSFDYDIETGKISNRTPFFSSKNVGIEGIFDGMTIDKDGNLWVAIFNGSKVIKVDPTKPDTLLQQIDIPAKQVTSVAWGGIDLDILYVISASMTIDGEVLSPPNHGALYRVSGLGTKGLPMAPFEL
ncbi:regucalcin-like [Anthonomus grandis grandis]|uniref:regucalcin-like n=1 Tax=Anthonomus grandis grandis TaxID=2921223 RepID=UPI00216618BD|nr:regucalcin-like [Anthonomus grandis grandis]